MVLGLEVVKNAGIKRKMELPAASHLHPKVNSHRSEFVDIAKGLNFHKYLNEKQEALLNRAFVAYRALAIMLYNFAQSGHPGGSISVGRQFLSLFLSGQMDYKIADSHAREGDMLALAAGHKAMGWYALNAFVNEAVKQTNPGLLSREGKENLFLEDLLGFRKNPAVKTPLREQLASKELDGHPTPATPFTFLTTGASGVGVAGAVGLAVAAKDIDRKNPSMVFCLEGEGGMTPGRVEEALQIARRAGLDNFVIMVDHNDASIDQADVTSGGYTEVKPEERGLLHGYNTIVADGKDFNQIVAALDFVREKKFKDNSLPTMIVLRTEKGEGYGFGTNKSHGGGHKMNSAEYFKAQEVFENTFGVKLDRTDLSKASPAEVETAFWNSLSVFREALSKDTELRDFMTTEVKAASERMQLREEERKADHRQPDLRPVFEFVESNPLSPENPPASLQYKSGDKVALREALGASLGEINKASNGGIIISAADLYGSLAFPKGIPYVSFPEGRVLFTGITEDAMSGITAGISTYGKHMGVLGSYGAFAVPMAFTAMRLDAIGYGATGKTIGNPMIVVAGHAGPKTGEDGPTHADPQCLSPMYSFPPGMAITLTPWDNREVWPLLLTSLRQKPAVIVPYVTRPAEKVLDLNGMGLADAAKETVNGVYHLKRPAAGSTDAWAIFQGSGVVNELLANGGAPLNQINASGLNIGIAYVSSRELFMSLPAGMREHFWGFDKASKAMAVTDFTQDTTFPWIMSEVGREFTLHPFKNGHFLGSGIGADVLKEGGLDGENIAKQVIAFAQRIALDPKSDRA